MAAKKNGVVCYADVVACALALPLVEESTSYGTPALKVRGKLMVRLWEDETTIVVKTDWDERERLLATYPEICFLTDHYRNYPYVLVRLPLISAGLMQSMVTAAWRLVAPKSLQTGDDAAPAKTSKRGRE
jgi:hypothetical protein